jgi:hypothetical protein
MPEPRKPTRKPVHLVASGGCITVQERIWAAIRARHLQGRSFTSADIAFESQQNQNSARRYIEQLLAGGYLRPLAERPRGEHDGRYTWQSYRLVRDVGVEAPRLRPDGTPATRGRSRAQMWRTMRIIGEFDGRELALAASTDEHAVDLQDALQYIKHLARAGYLQVVAPARGGCGRTLARYRFVPAMNTGPRPPMVQRTCAVFDPNLGRVVWPRGERT